MLALFIEVKRVGVGVGVLFCVPSLTLVDADHLLYRAHTVNPN